jgi:hypothetical protein
VEEDDHVLGVVERSGLDRLGRQRDHLPQLLLRLFAKLLRHPCGATIEKRNLETAESV